MRSTRLPRLRPFSGSKALVVLTDGQDTGSTHTAASATEEAQLSDAAVYVIQYPDAANDISQSNDLAALTLGTGGLLLSGPEHEPDELFSRIEADLRARYVLGFYAPNLSTAGRPHAIRVETVAPGVYLRPRNGYIEAP